jgi:hypothetical protein
MVGKIHSVPSPCVRLTWPSLGARILESNIGRDGLTYHHFRGNFMFPELDLESNKGELRRAITATPEKRKKN